jgi:hypothetical protein
MILGNATLNKKVSNIFILSILDERNLLIYEITIEQSLPDWGSLKILRKNLW